MDRVAEEVAEQHDRRRPADAAGGVPERELPPRHVHHPRDPRTEDAQARDPARDEDGHAALPREEVLAPGRASARCRRCARAASRAADHRSGRSRSRRCRRGSRRVAPTTIAQNTSMRPVAEADAREQQDRLARQREPGRLEEDGHEDRPRSRTPAYRSSDAVRAERRLVASPHQDRRRPRTTTADQDRDLRLERRRVAADSASSRRDHRSMRPVMPDLPGSTPAVPAARDRWPT